MENNCFSYQCDFCWACNKRYIFGYFSVFIAQLFITNIANESFNERTNLKPDLHNFLVFFKKKARQSLLHLGQLQRHQRNVKIKNLLQ